MIHALLAGHADDDLVAFGAAGARSARELLRDSAIIAAALPEARPGSQVLFVVRSDRYVLAASLLAALARGHAIALPPELGRAAITAIAEAPETAAIVHDTASGMAIKVDKLLAEGRDATPLTREQLRAHPLHARVFSRNEAGVLVCSAQSSDWLTQASSLSMQLAVPGTVRVASSVAPAQAYGIVFGVLMPLLTGGAFLREHAAVPSSLAARASTLRSRAEPRASTGSDLAVTLSALQVSVLVSVPAHLQRLARAARPTGLRQVVSAIHALTSELARELERAWQLTAVDLRERPPAGVMPWRATTAGDPCQTALGALSASALETLARAQPGVSDAAVAVLARDDSTAQRVLVALCGAGLDCAGVSAALVREFGAELAHAELLQVSEISRDSTGSFDRAQLLGLFRLRADGRPLNFALTWGAELTTRSEAAEQRVVSVHLPADYAYFEGHFPGYPILPAAAQLNEIVLPYVRGVRPQLGRLLQMTRLKFSGRIQPGETIEVALTLRPSSPVVDFVLRRARTICTTGTLHFAGEGASS